MKNQVNHLSRPKVNNHGFIRVAAAVPKMKVGDIDYNIDQIIKLAKKASDENVSIIVFPELSITGYTLGDLFHQQLVIEKAKEALDQITKITHDLKSVIIVGLPMEF